MSLFRNASFQLFPPTVGFRIVLAAGLFACQSGRAQQSEQVRVAWTDARFEEAIVATVKAADGKLSVLYDNRDADAADARRVTLADTRGTPDQIIQHLARAFRRQLIRQEGRYLVRSDRWFEPTTEDRKQDPRQEA